LINLDPDNNITVHFDAAAHASWSLSPPGNVTASGGGGGDEDPFSGRALLNGVLLPHVIDGGDNKFLEQIPVAATTGAGTATLLPLSVTFICY
jgi:hypothetical protein